MTSTTVKQVTQVVEAGMSTLRNNIGAQLSHITDTLRAHQLEIGKLPGFDKSLKENMVDISTRLEKQNHDLEYAWQTASDASGTTMVRTRWYAECINNGKY